MEYVEACDRFDRLVSERFLQVARRGVVRSFLCQRERTECHKRSLAYALIATIHFGLTAALGTIKRRTEAAVTLTLHAVPGKQYM